MFIHRETLSAHSAHLQKIPRWIVVIGENFSVNNQAFSTIVLSFCLFSSTNFTFDFDGFHIKRLTIIQYDFLNWHAEENLVVNNKDNRVFFRNYWFDSCLLEMWIS